MSIKYISPFKFIVIFTLLTLCGIFVIPLLQIQLIPSKSFPIIYISYNWRNATPGNIEEQVTSPLEQLLSQIQGIKSTSSISREGKGKITVHLARRTNLNEVRMLISNKIRNAYDQFPVGVTYPEISLYNPESENEQPLISYLVNLPSFSSPVRESIENRLIPSLSLISGISQVQLAGFPSFEWHLEYNQAQIASIGLTIGELDDLIKLQLRKENLGKLALKQSTHGKKEIEVFSGLELTYDQLERFLNTPLKNLGGKLLRIKDVISISRIESPPTSISRLNGKKAVSLVVYSTENSNILNLTPRVKNTINAFSNQNSFNLEFTLLYDASKFIELEIHKILERLAYTLGILLLFLVLITRDFTYIASILLSFIVTIVSSFFLYYLLSIPIHFFSLAGIMISMGIILDNFIIVVDHLLAKRKSNIILALSATTLTTISSLLGIYFLDEEVRLLLTDFVVILVVNLFASLWVAGLFIPSILQANHNLKTCRYTLQKKIRLDQLRRFDTLYFRDVYGRTLGILYKIRVLIIFLLILAFGVPVSFLPESLENNVLYNNTLGSSWFINNAKPFISKYLGGSLQVFLNEVQKNSSISSNEESRLIVRAKFPKGSNLTQIDQLVQRIERFLDNFPDELKYYQSIIEDRDAATITIYFNEAYDDGTFPILLKSLLFAKERELGGLSWYVHGYGRSFGEVIGESAGMSHLELYGYNYEILLDLANSLKNELEAYYRIKRVDVTWEELSRRPEKTTLVYNFDPKKLQINPNLHLSTFSAINSIGNKGSYLGRMYYNNNFEPILLASQRIQNKKLDSWKLTNFPIVKDSTFLKLSSLGDIEIDSINSPIYREDQTYRLIIQFDFIGTKQNKEAYIEELLASFKEKLPLGFRIINPNQEYLEKQLDLEKHYWVLLIIIASIYFICSILFESFIQPFAILLTIPISYIGIFLSFYFMEINFNEGGFASLILVTGITVNSAIYIVNEFNNLHKESKYKDQDRRGVFLDAFGNKIIPILLTIISTILGFIPFVLTTDKGDFWFSLANGTIYGLSCSLIAIIFYLPLFLGLREKKPNTLKSNSTHENS